ncbi:MAG TPA: hypothetical protein VM290_11520 [Gaiellaceae bacterium]|nr:hypothetical protein [Gaiellaceae bacterium]
MSTHPAPPELDAEAEVDLARYAARVAARWWLPLLGLLLGALAGYALSLGGEQVFRAQALVYLGQPFAPGGTLRVDTLATSPNAVREIVTSEAAVRRASRESGIRPARLREGISVAGMTGPARSAQAALVTIGVRGDGPRRVADAANVLAEEVVRDVSPYVAAKIEALERQVATADQEIASLTQRIDAALALAESGGLSATERLIALTNAGVLETRRATVQQSRHDRAQLLSLARTVEQPRVLQPAVAREVTARSRRNAVVVAAALGFLLGLAAALAWDPLAARARRAGAGG